MNTTIERLRRELADKIFDQGFHWKVLFVGTSVNGTTDIVSSLSRSLRNLGHHVLDIDTRKHRGMLHNPHRVSGGMGPIYVKHEKLAPILDSFEPQVVIFCAGGLTMTEEEAQLVKDRGIALVGITLSDPDVFPTVRDHNHVFDIHTTNAEIALDMYKEAGVENTVYFPFGIDRGFVTQDISYDAQFEADVICLGHANNRPDRNSVMTSLAREFDVRTYGRGWEVPNSVTVAGEQMVQALKAGRIHINFPLTRAGFINIKCGVFESAGQGALVATGQFPEMEKFFTYGEDIVGYDNDEDLAEKIRWLLDNPDEYDRIAENGFRRVITEHLYEHRWMELFARLADLNGENSGWLPEDRRQALRGTLARSYGRVKKVIVAGFYGARNLGDELILSSITQALHKEDDSVQVVVASENAVNVESSHGLQAFKRTNHAAAAYEVETASAVIVGGGGLWHDYTYEAGGGLLSLFNGGTVSMAGFGVLPMMGRVLDRPYHVVGLGVGPLEDRGARQTVKFLADQTSSLYVRDPESARLLESLPVDSDRITVGPDVVYGVDLPAPAVDSLPTEVAAAADEGYRIVALNMRPWKAADMDAVNKRVAEALNALAETHRIAVVGVPMQAGASFDARAIAQVADLLTDEIPVVSLEAPIDTATLAAVYDRADAVLAMRLHACLVAHRYTTPAVGLCYDPKVERHFAEVERPSAGLGLNAGAEEIRGALATAIDGGMSADSASAVRALESEAQRALAVAAKSIAESPRVDAVYTVPDESVSPKSTPTAEGSTTLTMVKGAYFRAMVPSAERVELVDGGRGKPALSNRAVSVALPTENPQRGMSVSVDGHLRRVVSTPGELCFRVTNAYANPKVVGKLFFELTIGDQVLREDIAASDEPIIVRYFTRASGDVPVSLRVFAEKKTFSSASWPRATRVHVALVGTLPLEEDIGGDVLVATRGTVTRKG